MDCPFCTPDIMNSVFARDGNFLALYNVSPILPGHSLIIPLRHAGSMMDLNEDELARMLIFTRKVSSLLMKVFSAEAFNWSLQDGMAAGQTVAHLHLHIVLRFPDDLPEPGDWYPKVEANSGELLDSTSRHKLTPGVIEGIVTRLRREAKSAGLY